MLKAMCNGILQGLFISFLICLCKAQSKLPLNILDYSQQNYRKEFIKLQ